MPFTGSGNFTNGIIRNLRGLPAAIASDPELKKELEATALTMMQQEIGSTLSGLAWGEGRQEDMSVDLVSNITPRGVTVQWANQYAPFIEYGTGRKGAESPYPRATGEYSPQPEGHGNTGGSEWNLPRELTGGEAVWTEGWEPYAPVYKALVLNLPKVVNPALQKLVVQKVSDEMRT